MRAFVFFFFQNLGRTHHLARAFGKRRSPMISECRRRQLQLLFDLCCGKRLESLQDFAGRRIGGRDCHSMSSS